ATIMWGSVLAAEGQTEEGLVRIQEGLAAQRATGAEAVAPYFLALQAETYGKMGQLTEGLAALAEASAMVRRTGEQWYEAELYRIKGELTLQKLPVASRQLSVPNPQPLTPSPNPKPKRVFLKLSTLHASSRRSRWSCEQ